MEPDTSSVVVPWIERVPRLATVAVAAAAVVAAAVAFAAIAASGDGWGRWAEPLLAAVALVTVLVSPIRLGPVLALATVGLYFVLDLASRGFDERLSAQEVVAAFLLLGALLAASYVRLGIRQRETELAIARDAIAELTRSDPLTMLLSGRRPLTWLEAEIGRARRHHRDLTLTLVRPDAVERLDVSAGDDLRGELLQATAEVIGNELRTTDVAVRYDDVTFALIFPETTTEGARVAAERIRLLLPHRFAADPAVTVSCGIAAFPRDAATESELVHVAERVLERAVELGGNRTLCASVEPGAPIGWTLAGAV